MKYSRQRELIREAVAHSSQHPTADAVYQEVRKKESNISLATVYRNLNQLADNGLIRRVTVPGEPEHFDHTMAYHEHMICTKCGRVVDIWPEKPLYEQFEAFSNMGVTGYDLILYGVCPACAQHNNLKQDE